MKNIILNIIVLSGISLNLLQTMDNRLNSLQRHEFNLGLNLGITQNVQDSFFDYHRHEADEHIDTLGYMFTSHSIEKDTNKYFTDIEKLIILRAIQKKLNVRLEKYEKKPTFLHLAVYAKSATAFKMLLAYGADPNIPFLEKKMSRQRNWIETEEVDVNQAIKNLKSHGYMPQSSADEMLEALSIQFWSFTWSFKSPQERAKLLGINLPSSNEPIDS